MDNIEQLYNTPTPAVNGPAIGNNSGVSAASQMAMQVANTTFDTGLESLSESLKRISATTVPTFNELYTPQLSGQGGFSISGNGGGGGLNLFSTDPGQEMSWEGDKIDMNQYFDRTSESWSNLDKDSAGMATGAGVLTGAATGAAIGSLFTPVGTAIGAVVGGILGGIEGNQVSKNVGYGYVRNKYGVDENSLYNQQGFIGRAGAGLMNMVHSADSLTLGSLGTIAYLPKAISERSLNVLFNNDFTKLLDDYDKSSQSSNRIYHSQEYDNSSLLGKLAHSEMWFEQVAPAVGFMVGAIGVGRATGLAMGAAGLGGATTGAASRAFLSETIGAAAKGEAQSLGRQALLNGFKQAARQDLASQTFKSMAGNFTTLLTSAAPESGLEARGAMNESQENYIKAYENAYGRLPSSSEIDTFNKSNITAANGVFAANLAVVGMSNWLQFGDAMGLNRVVKNGFMDDAVNRVFGLGIKKTMGEVSEKGIQSAVWDAVRRTKLQKVGYRAMKALEAPATEGLWEEGIQHVISGTHKNYLESRFNPQTTQINKSLLDSFGESFVNTYTTEEGWNDIMIGMIVGAGGTARVKGGVDFLNQRQVSREVAGINQNVANLNQTQEELVSAQGDYLSKQSIYNNLANGSTSRLHDKIGGLNQQMTNSDLSKKYVASGNLEQAQLAYQNALFAKLSAEKRAGLSDSNKYDMETMIENIPQDTLTELYNFKTPEDISNFKTESKATLNNLVESFDAAYELAESLNLGTNTKDFSPTQVTEMAALNFFHGMHSADNANNLAQAIEKSIGINGIADSLNYYSNLGRVQQGRITELENLQLQLQDLERKHSDLLDNFSTQVSKPVRQPSNEGVVSQLDKINGQLEGVQSEIESVNNRITSLTNILNAKESVPVLPFGNPAMKFFDSINLSVADGEVSNVLSNLQSLDTYMKHLLDTTEKSEDDIAIDRNKAEMLESMVGAYKTQMALMRSFAKTAQMVSDPAYLNNMSKSIFNSKKYDAIFDNSDWVTNNESGFDELSKEEYKLLKEKLDSGVISKYDVHTYMSNAEILRMGTSIQQGNTLQEVGSDVISKEDLQEMTSQDEDGNINIDLTSEAYQRSIQGIAEDLASGNELSPNQKLVYDAIKTNEEELSKLNQTIQTLRAEVEVSPLTLGSPERNTQLAEEQRLTKIAEDKKKEIEQRYEAQINSLTESDLEVSDIDNLIDNPINQSDPIGDLEAAMQKELDEVDAQLQKALTPTETRNVEINTELDKLNTFIDNVVEELRKASKQINVGSIDNFDLKPSNVTKMFEDYAKLFNIEDRTNNQEAELEELKSRINQYGLVEGRVVDYNGVSVRLSDILEQRNFLENEYFSTDSELNPLDDVETTRVTTDSPTDEFTAKTKGGDPTVLNNYDFATFTGSNSSNEVTIANITPSLLINELLKDKQGSTIEVDNTEVGLDGVNESINAGQAVRTTFTDNNGEVNRVSFQLDKSRRIILPQGDIEALEANSNLRFNPDNLIGSSGYYTLTLDNNGTQVPVRSDFDLANLIDSEAAQRLSPGDAISFEVEMNSSYNQGLMNRLAPYLSSVPQEERVKLEPILNMATEAVDNTTRIAILKSNIASTNSYIKELDSQIEVVNDAASDAVNLAEYNKNVVYPLLEKSDVEHKKIEAFQDEIDVLQSRNKEVRTILNADYNKIPYDRIVRNIEKKLGKSKLSDAQQKEFDAVRKEMKDNMVVVAKDKSGNTIGVIKSFNNSNGVNAQQMDYLRGSLFEAFENNGFQAAKSSFTVPVQIVYMGIPNVSTTEDGKVLYEFSRETGDTFISPNKVSDIGFVTYNELSFNSGSKYSTPYNYAQSIFRDKSYMGKKVPVIMFKHNGKNVIYPISLKESLDSSAVVSQFEAMYNDKSKDFSTYLNDINEFLSANKVSPKYRLNSLNFSDEYVQEISEVISNSEFYPSVEEFLNSSNITQTLIDNALIDIDLNNKPFIGPKVKIALSQVPEFTSDLSNTDKVINDNSSIKSDMENNIEENKCNIELD